MRTSYILFVFVFISTIGTTTFAWRSKSSSETGITIGDRGPKRIGAGAAGDKERHKQQHHAKKEESNGDAKNETQHYNIGLIVPHTNFGKREYQRAIGWGYWITLFYYLSRIPLAFLMDAFIKIHRYFMIYMYIVYVIQTMAYFNGPLLLHSKCRNANHLKCFPNIENV